MNQHAGHDHPANTNVFCLLQCSRGKADLTLTGGEKEEEEGGEEKQDSSSFTLREYAYTVVHIERDACGYVRYTYLSKGRRNGEWKRKIYEAQRKLTRVPRTPQCTHTCAHCTTGGGRWHGTVYKCARVEKKRTPKHR